LDLNDKVENNEGLLENEFFVSNAKYYFGIYLVLSIYVNKYQLWWRSYTTDDSSFDDVEHSDKKARRDVAGVGYGDSKKQPEDGPGMVDGTV
jgi:hypothetical protein